MGITEAELESIRTAQLEFLPDHGIIRRRNYAGDDNFDFITIATDVHCRLTPGFGSWRTVADRFQGITPFRLTVVFDQDIRPGDRFIDENSNTYEVRDVSAPKTYHTARQALMDLVNDG